MDVAERLEACRIGKSANSPAPGDIGTITRLAGRIGIESVDIQQSLEIHQVVHANLEGVPEENHVFCLGTRVAQGVENARHTAAPESTIKFLLISRQFG